MRAACRRPRCACGGGVFVTCAISTADASSASNGKRPDSAKKADDAERVDVAARVDRVARDLFGAEVVHGAEHLSRRRERRRLGEPRDAEVGDERASGRRVEQNVLGFHVAVNDAMVVGEPQRARDVTQLAQRLRAGRVAARSRMRCASDSSVHEAHDEEHVAVQLVGAMDGHDVWVRQPPRGSRLAQKPLADDRRPTARCGGKRLDRDAAIELQVAREIHDAHAAAADLALELILAGERGGEARRGVGEVGV